MPDDVLLSGEQLAHLRRIGIEAPRISNRNTPGLVARSTLGPLTRAGLAVEVDGYAEITDAGVGTLAVNAGHVPPLRRELAAYQRGLAAAYEVRQTAIRELQALVDEQSQQLAKDRDEPGLRFARSQLERFLAINKREEATHGR